MCNKKEELLNGSLDTRPLDGVRGDSSFASKQVDENNNSIHSSNDQKQPTSLLASVKHFIDFIDRNVNRFETEIRWPHVLFMATFHLIALHALFLILTFRVKLQTILFTVFLHYLCNMGLTAGVHRLWSHKAYKARLPLRIFLMLCQTLTFQKSIITWSRDHRIHHKYSETDQDPHDIRRGVFFAHIGWILLRKRPEVFEAGRKISLDDLYADSVVRFQARTYFPLMLLLCFVLPTWLPMHYWGECYLVAFQVCVALRHVIVLNLSFLINSYAHLIGHRKYDLTLKSTDNYAITVLSAGEGTHNFHHAFPFDYSTSELDYVFNLTTTFIDLMAWLGQAYDLKRTSPEMVLARRKRTGDLSSYSQQHKEQ